MVSLEKLLNDDANQNAIMCACLIAGFANLSGCFAMGLIAPKTDDINQGLILAMLFASTINMCGFIISTFIVSSL